MSFLIIELIPQQAYTWYIIYAIGLGLAIEITKDDLQTLTHLQTNDLICLVFMTAAVETKTTDPAIPAIRQKLDKAVEKVKVNVKLGEIYQGFCCICDMNV